LLDLAKGEVGMLQLKLETIDLAELLTETAEAMSPLASRRGQSLTLIRCRRFVLTRLVCSR